MPLPKRTNPPLQKPTPQHDRRPPVYTPILHHLDGRDPGLSGCHVDSRGSWSCAGGLGACSGSLPISKLDTRNNLVACGEIHR